MRKAAAFAVFYLQVLFPSLVLTMLIAFISRYFGISVSIIETLCKTYLPVSLVVLLMQYEVRFRNEKYFYYGLGLSKYSLYGFSLATGMLAPAIQIISGF